MSSLIIAAIAGHVTIGLAGPIDSGGTTASAYCSNLDLSYALSSLTAPVEGAGSPGSESAWALTIDDTSAGYKQSITRLGAAVTDATVASFGTLSSSSLDTYIIVA
ncbi:hypothetical protein OIDMADRAFT_60556 [Oidiodendron maius Zn]|uniref:Uncharacterized protein n=1 Tax=Oidiodendron maius (strain Zn) TaxID=913774 RepID=A0A0C3C7A8_OIDMZ|nr:hypothetical protein OIDMADRAFT_60556 [Oidiodendron maius Zn]